MVVMNATLSLISLLMGAMVKKKLAGQTRKELAKLKELYERGALIEVYQPTTFCTNMVAMIRSIRLSGSPDK